MARSAWKFTNKAVLNLCASPSPNRDPTRNIRDCNARRKKRACIADTNTHYSSLAPAHGSRAFDPATPTDPDRCVRRRSRKPPAGRRRQGPGAASTARSGPAIRRLPPRSRRASARHRHRRRKIQKSRRTIPFLHGIISASTKYAPPCRGRFAARHRTRTTRSTHSRRNGRPARGASSVNNRRQRTANIRLRFFIHTALLKGTTGFFAIAHVRWEKNLMSTGKPPMIHTGWHNVSVRCI